MDTSIGSTLLPSPTRVSGRPTAGARSGLGRCGSLEVLCHPAGQNWDMGGMTLVTPDYVRLTPDRQSTRGGIWNRVVSTRAQHSTRGISSTLSPRHVIQPLLLQPVRFHNWELVVHFAVHGSGDLLFGDGFAFWYTKDKGTEGEWCTSAMCGWAHVLPPSSPHLPRACVWF